MEEFHNEEVSAMKQDKKNLLLTSKDPHLSHLLGDDPRTPNSIGSADISSHSVMEDGGQFHDEESREPEYRLFEEQSYVAEMSPSNEMMMGSSGGLENADNPGVKSSLPEAATSSSSQPGKSTKNSDQRKILHPKVSPNARKSNGPRKVKAYICKEQGCGKAYSDPRSLRKHTIKFHFSDVNNNNPADTATQSGRTSETSEKQSSVPTGSEQQPNFNELVKGRVDCTTAAVNQITNYQPTLASSDTGNHGEKQNGPVVFCQPSDSQINVIENNNGSDKGDPQSLQAVSFTVADNSNYNMQLLAHSAQQHLLQQQHLLPSQQQVVLQTDQIDTANGGNANHSAASDYLHQSSTALQQLAMRVHMRENTMHNATGTDPLSSEAPSELLAGAPVTSMQHQFLSAPLSDVRAQLRKTLSSNGKLESAGAPHDWPRMVLQTNLAQTMNLGNTHGQSNIYLTKMASENDPTNIDNAPMLKDLLSSSSGMQRSNSVKADSSSQANSNLSIVPYAHSALQQNSWSGDGMNAISGEPLTSPHLQSPILKSKQTIFPYHRNPDDVPQVQSSPNPNPSPMHSPAFHNTPQFQTPSNQATPLPQNNETQFFSPDDIMVNNNNNQQPDTQTSNLNDMIAESENFVQDLIDEAAANSNHGSSHSLMASVQEPFVQGGQGIDDVLQGPVRVTPPPAYHLNPHTGLLDREIPGQAGQIYMDQNCNHLVKSEPQSPMITSPIRAGMFFNSGPGSMQSLASPRNNFQQALQPPTPTGDAQWQFPISGQNQNYRSVPPSPTQPQARPVIPSMPQDGGSQNVGAFVPRQRAPAVGNPKSVRARRTSGGSARKNPDGTLSCAICGHSFRSVPALNGHMRVHSSSSEKKNKDERQRKASGSSNGGSKTPQPLSSPSTPTYKIAPTSMYHNVSYNTNPAALYNPALNSSMEGGGSVVTISQHDDAREPPMVHRIAQQSAGAGLYSYPIAHSMLPKDALFAAANLVSMQGDFQKVGHLSGVPDLQNIQYLAQQTGAKVDLQGGYRDTPSATGMILVPPPGTVLPQYLSQGEQIQATNMAGLPFVSLALPNTATPMYRPAFAGSPPQEVNAANQGHLENLYLQQPLLQQPNNRSTPLEDFADIAVAHNQGQLFSTNSVLVAPQLQTEEHAQVALQQQQQQQQNHQQEHQRHGHSEHLHLQDVTSDIGLLASVSKDLLWRPDAQPSMVKMDRDDSLPLKEEDFLQTSFQMHKPNEQMQHQNQPSDPFTFSVSVPVQCSRDDTAPVTTTAYYTGHSYDDYSNNLAAFHDDPLMQDAINVANPSKILPNSMMGGNPSGPSFRSYRQRHHSEGSVLKKILHADVPGLQLADGIKSAKLEMGQHYPSKTPPASMGLNEGQIYPMPLAGVKRKSEIVSQVTQQKKVKLEARSPNDVQRRPSQEKKTELATVKTEVWTVPTQAPPNRMRHRRHSADSRVPYRSSHLLSRSSYLSPFQSASTMANKSVYGRQSFNNAETREKRRPPPLIIPASVNTYTNGGMLYMSQLHHRRRPSGDSSSSCGNDKIPPYTPPPMLSPLRFGTGLYSNTPITPGHKPLLYRQVSAEHTIATIPEEVDEELVRSADPKINIGTEYQAELPDLRPKSEIVKDVHKAVLVWKPTPEISKDNSTQSRHVEEFMKLACSAAVPYGGCNKEYALHLLHKNNGDILASVRQLLNMAAKVPPDHWMANHTYPGAVRWTLKDRQVFEHATMQHHKDFYLISKMVGTKTTADCVDYYYHTVKRRKRRVQRPRRFRQDSDGEENKISFSSSPHDSDAYISEDDFMEDHAKAMKESESGLQRNFQQNGSAGYRTVEVIRRSPTSTAFIQAPQANRMTPGISQTPPPALINFSPAPQSQHAPVQVYPRQPLHSYTTQQQNLAPNGPVAASKSMLMCKMPGCSQSFPTPQLLFQHQQTHKSLKPYLDRLNRASPSPANSPASAASVDADTPQPVFSCPRCGKTFGKVKSRNAHMKTHGKHAQEKRRQKEEEARRKMEEATAWKKRSQQHVYMPPPHGQERTILQFQASASPQQMKPPGM